METANRLISMGLFILTESINAFRSTLNLINKKQNPEDWEYNQYKLGRALQNLGFANSDCQSLNEAVDAFRSALECVQLNDLMVRWERYFCLGLSLFVLYKENNGDSTQLSDAADLFNSAIDLMSIEEHGWDFANAHRSYGDAMHLLGELNGDAGCFKLAIDSYKQSQRIFTKKDDLEQWTELQDKIKHVSSLI